MLLDLLRGLVGLCLVHGLANPVHEGEVVMDGSMLEWAELGIATFPVDPAEGHSVDYIRSAIAHDSSHVYIREEFSTDVVLDARKIVFIDTDQSDTTGYLTASGTLSIGADFMLQSTQLLAYSGAGTDWSWSLVGEIQTGISGGSIERAVAWASLGNPEELRVVFFGDGATRDFYPDGADDGGQYFQYSGKFDRTSTLECNAPSMVGGEELTCTIRCRRAWAPMFCTTAAVDVSASSASPGPLTQSSSTSLEFLITADEVTGKANVSARVGGVPISGSGLVILIMAIDSSSLLECSPLVALPRSNIECTVYCRVAGSSRACVPSDLAPPNVSAVEGGGGTVSAVEQGSNSTLLFSIADAEAGSSFVVRAHTMDGSGISNSGLRVAVASLDNSTMLSCHSTRASTLSSVICRITCMREFVPTACDAADIEAVAMHGTVEELDTVHPMELFLKMSGTGDDLLSVFLADGVTPVTGSPLVTFFAPTAISGALLCDSDALLPGARFNCVFACEAEGSPAPCPARLRVFAEPGSVEAFVNDTKMEIEYTPTNATTAHGIYVSLDNATLAWTIIDVFIPVKEEPWSVSAHPSGLGGVVHLPEVKDEGLVGWHVYRRRRLWSGPSPVAEDGHVDWASVTPLSSHPYPPEDLLGIQNVWMADDGVDLHVRVDVAGAGHDVEVLMDLDLDRHTGLNHFGLFIGADARVLLMTTSSLAQLQVFDPDYDGGRREHDSAWTTVEQVEYQMSGVSPLRCEFVVPIDSLRAALGLPPTPPGLILSSGHLFSVDVVFASFMDQFPTVGYSRGSPCFIEYGHRRVTSTAMVVAAAVLDDTVGALGDGTAQEYALLGVYDPMLRSYAEVLWTTTHLLDLPAVLPLLDVSVVDAYTVEVAVAVPAAADVERIRVTRYLSSEYSEDKDNATATVVFDEIVASGDNVIFLDGSLVPGVAYIWTSQTLRGGAWSPAAYSTDTCVPTTPRGPIPSFGEGPGLGELMMYFSVWDEAQVRAAELHSLVVVHAGGGSPLITREQVEDIKDGADNVQGTGDDVIVLGYASLAQDYGVPGPEGSRRSNPRSKEGGRGPVTYDYITGEKSYLNMGHPEYYLDMMELSGGSREFPESLHFRADGYPDQDEQWWSFYVDPSNEEWLDMLYNSTKENGLIGLRSMLEDDQLGLDGVFVDAMRSVAPWMDNWRPRLYAPPYFWARDGALNAIARIGASFPDKYIVTGGEYYALDYGKRRDDFRAYVSGVVWDSHRVALDYWWSGSGDVFSNAVAVAQDNADSRGFTTFPVDYHAVVMEATEGGQWQGAPLIASVAEYLNGTEEYGFYGQLMATRDRADRSLNPSFFVRHPQTLPDLRAHSLIPDHTANATTGVFLPVRLGVVNYGAPSSTSSIAEFYTNSDLVAVLDVPPLSTGEVVYFQRSATLREEGSLLRLVVDSASQVEEFDENNNEGQQYMDAFLFSSFNRDYLAPSLPDLVLRNPVSFPDVPFVGETFTISVAYANLGATVAGAARLFAWLGSADTWEGRHVLNERTPWLMPNETKTLQYTFQIDTAGAYVVDFTADATALITEADEGSNNAPLTMYVEPPRGQLIDWSPGWNVAGPFRDKALFDGTAGSESADLLSLSIAQSLTEVLFRVEMRGHVDFRAFSIVLQIDTDDDKATGYTTTYGSDRLIINGGVYNYTGVPGGNAWTWKLIGLVAHLGREEDERFVNIAVLKSMLGLPDMLAEDQMIRVWVGLNDGDNDTPDDDLPGYGSMIAWPPSCADGQLNQDEVRVDCGGSRCEPCETIVVDGEIEDWIGIPAMYENAGGEASSPFTIVAVYGSHSAADFFFRVDVAGDVDMTEGDYSLFISLMSDAASFLTAWEGPTRAELVFLEGVLHVYSGTGNEWSWATVLPTKFRFAHVGSVMEFSINRAYVNRSEILTPLRIMASVSDLKGTPEFDDDVTAYVPAQTQAGLQYPHGAAAVDGSASEWKEEHILWTQSPSSASLAPVLLGGVEDDDTIYLLVNFSESVALTDDVYIYLHTKSETAGFLTRWGVTVELAVINGVLSSYTGGAGGGEWSWAATFEGQYRSGRLGRTLEISLAKAIVPAGPVYVLVESTTDATGEEVTEFLPPLAGKEGVPYPRTCGDAFLHYGEECDDGSTSPLSCCSSTCTAHSSDRLCREAASTCDVPDLCMTGTGTCSADVKQTLGFPCDDLLACNGLQDECDGLGACKRSTLSVDRCPIVWHVDGVATEWSKALAHGEAASFVDFSDDGFPDILRITAAFHVNSLNHVMIRAALRFANPVEAGNNVSIHIDVDDNVETGHAPDGTDVRIDVSDAPGHAATAYLYTTAGDVSSVHAEAAHSAGTIEVALLLTTDPKAVGSVNVFVTAALSDGAVGDRLPGSGSLTFPVTALPVCGDNILHWTEECDDLSVCCADCLTVRSCETCTNGIRDGSETGVDCGGGAVGCDQCPTAFPCVVDVDCVSGVCSGAACQESSCVDAVKNGVETDVDCGAAPCPLCGIGQSCRDEENCWSKICENTTCTAPSCDDLVKNGEEEDVDCGGAACPRCAEGQTCLFAASCQSGVCLDRVCQPHTCADMVRNGEETDVDCGPFPCLACREGLRCSLGLDCASGVCKSSRCQAPSCEDGTHNGPETDVDCGGECGACLAGAACLASSDCVFPLTCVASVCRSDDVPVCGDDEVTGDEECEDGGVEGNCCVGCKLLAAGTLCRAPRDECDVAEACSGSSVPCPEDLLTPRGHPCANASGSCSDGGCVLRGVSTTAVMTVLPSEGTLSSPRWVQVVVYDAEGNPSRFQDVVTCAAWNNATGTEVTCAVAKVGAGVYNASVRPSEYGLYGLRFQINGGSTALLFFRLLAPESPDVVLVTEQPEGEKSSRFDFLGEQWVVMTLAFAVGMVFCCVLLACACFCRKTKQHVDDLNSTSIERVPPSRERPKKERTDKDMGAWSDGDDHDFDLALDVQGLDVDEEQSSSQEEDDLDEATHAEDDHLMTGPPLRKNGLPPLPAPKPLKSALKKRSQFTPPVPAPAEDGEEDKDSGVGTKKKKKKGKAKKSSPQPEMGDTAMLAAALETISPQAEERPNGKNVPLPLLPDDTQALEEALAVISPVFEALEEDAGEAPPAPPAEESEVVARADAPAPLGVAGHAFLPDGDDIASNPRLADSSLTTLEAVLPLRASASTPHVSQLPLPLPRRSSASALASPHSASSQKSPVSSQRSLPRLAGGRSLGLEDSVASSDWNLGASTPDRSMDPL